jgi:hypothetical protein
MKGRGVEERSEDAASATMHNINTWLFKAIVEGKMWGPLFLMRDGTNITDPRVIEQMASQKITRAIYEAYMHTYDTADGPYGVIRRILRDHGLTDETVTSVPIVVRGDTCQAFFGGQDAAKEDGWFTHPHAPTVFSGEKIRGPLIVMPAYMTRIMYWRVGMDDRLNAVAKSRITGDRDAEAEAWAEVEDYAGQLGGGICKLQLMSKIRDELDARIPPPLLLAACS